MRLVMMGTGPFAVPTFRSLLDSPHAVLALVTRPPVSVRTRGQTKVPPNPMRAVAEARGLPMLDPVDINAAAARDQLAALRPDILVVCDYGQILSAETLAIPPLGGINLHGSLLPKFRGAAPVQRALWNGEDRTGVTVIHMTPRLDGGPCLAQCQTPIGPTETALELEPRLALLGVDLVHAALDQLACWDRVTPLGCPQDATQASRAPRLTKQDGNVDWARPAWAIYHQFRAVQPWPGLFTYLLQPRSTPCRILLEVVRPENGIRSDPPGAIAVNDEHELLVATGNGLLVVERLQPAAGRAMSAQEFLRGRPLDQHSRFGSVDT